MEMKMENRKENFFIDDKFYNEIVDYIEDNDYDNEEIEKLTDDWKVVIRLSNYEPIFQFTMDWLVERIIRETDYFEDRFPEDSDVVDTQIENAIRQSVDLEKLNSLLPKLYYPSDKTGVLTKQDLLESL